MVTRGSLLLSTRVERLQKIKPCFSEKKQGFAKD